MRADSRSPNGGRTVAEEGAAAGACLRGFAKSNEGIRIRVRDAQPRGAMGAIKGQFVIEDVGDNTHSDTLRPLLNIPTNAAEVIVIIRRKNSACINVANVNILTCEDEAAKGN